MPGRFKPANNGNAGGGGNEQTPTYIAPSKQFEVLEDSQVLFLTTIKNDGILKLTGILSELR